MSGSVVLEVDEKVVVEAPEDLKCNSTMRSGDAVICLLEKIAIFANGMESLFQQGMTQTIRFDRILELLN